MSKDIILSKMQYSKYSKISVTASNTYLKQKLYKEKDSQTEVLHAGCVCMHVRVNLNTSNRED